MVRIIKALIKNDRLWETIKYVFFGGLTTLINFLIFTACVNVMGDSLALIANAVAFVAAVAFAFWSNKLFVFRSLSWTADVLKREIPVFVGARLLSFGFEELGLFILVNLLGVGQYRLLGFSGVLIAKGALSVVSIIVNYVVSKYYIFKAPPKPDTPNQNANPD